MTAFIGSGKTGIWNNEEGEMLDNFYMKLPGGWLKSFISESKSKRLTLDSLVNNSNKITYRQIFEDVRKAMLESGLTKIECEQLESMSPLEQKVYIVDNQRRYVPLMIKAYNLLIKKGYRHQDLTS